MVCRLQFIIYFSQYFTKHKRSSRIILPSKFCAHLRFSPSHPSNNLDQGNSYFLGRVTTSLTLPKFPVKEV